MVSLPTKGSKSLHSPSLKFDNFLLCITPTSADGAIFKFSFFFLSVGVGGGGVTATEGRWKLK